MCALNAEKSQTNSAIRAQDAVLQWLNTQL